jgi:hypothetical protein
MSIDIHREVLGRTGLGPRSSGRWRSSFVSAEGETPQTAPLLACVWLECGLRAVPLEFGCLIEGVGADAPPAGAIADLPARKRAGGELEWGPRIPATSDHLDAHVERPSGLQFPVPERSGRPSPDTACHRILVALHGDGIEA